MPHSHWPGGPACDLSTKKACEDRKADWDAMQQVLLAYRVAASGRTSHYRKEASVFARLVQWMAGERESLDNKDGTPSEAPFVKRILAAVERVKAGDIPSYNLYTPE